MRAGAFHIRRMERKTEQSGRYNFAVAEWTCWLQLRDARLLVWLDSGNGHGTVLISGLPLPALMRSFSCSCVAIEMWPRCSLAGAKLIFKYEMTLTLRHAFVDIRRATLTYLERAIIRPHVNCIKTRRMREQSRRIDSKRSWWMLKSVWMSLGPLLSGYGFCYIVTKREHFTAW